MIDVQKQAGRVSTALLLVGMALWLPTHGEPSPAAGIALAAGLAVLAAMPVARLLLVIEEEVKARDWRFVALGLAVLLLLAGSVMISTRR
jgi:hypothetical protein